MHEWVKWDDICPGQFFMHRDCLWVKADLETAVCPMTGEYANFAGGSDPWEVVPVNINIEKGFNPWGVRLVIPRTD